MNEEQKDKNTFKEKVSNMTQYLLKMRRNQDKADAEFLASLGALSMQQLGVLNIVGDHQSCTMTTIAVTATLSLSSTTLVVDKLVRKRLAKRRRSDKDRRVIYVELTQDGNDIYQTQIEHLKTVVSIVLATLSNQEQEILLQFMQRFSSL